LFTIPAVHLYSAKRKRGQKDSDEIRFWHSIGTYNKEVLNSFIGAFNESSRTIFVKSEFQGSEEDLLLKLLSQENLPEIALIPVQYLPSLLKEKDLLELTSLLPQKMKENIPAQFWDSVSLEGKIFGIPFAYSTNIFYVNQHILRISGVQQEKVPATWEDMVSVTAKIQRNTKDKWPLFIPMETVPQFIAFVQSYTGTPVVQNGRFVVNTDEVIEAMRFLQDLMYEQKIMPPKVTLEECESLFLAGNLGILMAQSSTLVYMESNLPFDLNVWHLLSLKNSRPLITGSCLIITQSNPRRGRDAFKFIEYLVSHENAINWHTHTGYPAIQNSVKESLDLLIFYEESPNHMTSAIELDKGEIFTGFSNYMQLNSIMKRVLEEIMINRQDPAEILTGAQVKIDTLHTESVKNQNAEQ
jgi:ABC-type glycerol-3-phosphate transport system substrate-binding protein